MKKILICSNVYPPNFIGGAELIAHYQAKALHDMGHEVLIFTGDIAQVGNRHAMRKEMYDGLTVYRTRLVSEDYRSDYVNFKHTTVEASFNKVITEFKPDVVHFHNIIGLSLGLIAIANSMGCKTVITLHDHWGFCYRNTLINSANAICDNFTNCSTCMATIDDGLHRNIPIRFRQDFFNIQMRKLDNYISPSQYLADTYVKAGFEKDKMHVVWNGLDVSRFLQIEKKNSDRVRFTFIGHLGEHKGISVLLKALLLVRNKNALFINIVGGGEKEHEYKEFVKANRLQDFVRFWGKIDNAKISSVYSETDVIILPSIWPENQPVSITEAMAAGIPVIASNVGGIPELVDDGKNGLIFEMGNENDLAKKIGWVLENRSTIELFGQHGRSRIIENTFANQAKKIVEIYELPALKPTRKTKKIIGIVGERISNPMSKALELSLPGIEKTDYVVSMIEWLDSEDQDQLAMMVVVDQTNWLESVMLAISKGIPLVVNSGNDELKALCIKANCGLYYDNEHEAELCIQYLCTNDTVRQALGSNAFRYWNELTQVRL